MAIAATQLFRKINRNRKKRKNKNKTVVSEFVSWKITDAIDPRIPSSAYKLNPTGRPVLFPKLTMGNRPGSRAADSRPAFWEGSLRRKRLAFQSGLASRKRRARIVTHTRTTLCAEFRRLRNCRPALGAIHGSSRFYHPRRTVADYLGSGSSWTAVP